MASRQVRGRRVTADPVSRTSCLFKKQLHDTNSDPPWMELMGLQEQFPSRPQSLPGQDGSQGQCRRVGDPGWEPGLGCTTLAGGLLLLSLGFLV